jgi:hypothetical protein
MSTPDRLLRKPKNAHAAFYILAVLNGRGGVIFLIRLYIEVTEAIKASLKITYLVHRTGSLLLLP